MTIDLSDWVSAVNEVCDDSPPEGWITMPKFREATNLSPWKARAAMDKLLGANKAERRQFRYGYIYRLLKPNQKTQ